ncbi:MAG TPA: aldo/keto reductase [Jiangellaceae bacterium]|nr:aldo/keto reductase [Jiangellaceae bacterium]
MSDHTVTLTDGDSMPLLGFGTWQIHGREAYDAVRVALDVGYRHIDTATLYRNEAEIGRALRDSDVAREDVFLTTKLHPDDVGREDQVLKASLAALGTDYLDLWLVHWPPRGRASVAAWGRLVDAHAKGFARAIGISNYSTAQIDELVDATGVTPAVNQIRWSPELYDRRRVDQLRARGVVLEGYSPFRASNLRDPVLVDIASAHSVTAAQVVLRWHIDHGFVVIPKSVRRERIAANFDVFGFSLTAAELARIDALGHP